MSTFDEDEIKSNIDIILIQSDGSLQIELQNEVQGEEFNLSLS